MSRRTSSPRRVRRRTETPIKALRRVHERLTRLLMSIEPPAFLFCPVKGRSQIDNALYHRNATVVRTLDIKNYFPCTPTTKVRWFFYSVMRCAPDVSAILAKICTKNGRLPTGSPLSPILAFYAFFEMWNEIARLARNTSCLLSVYMDDITVSGRDVPGSLIWQIKQTIHNAGLRYHKEHSYRSEPAIVTGVVVFQGKLLLPYRQHLKAHETRVLWKEAISSEEALGYERRLSGLISHRRQIESATSKAVSRAVA